MALYINKALKAEVDLNTKFEEFISVEVPLVNNDKLVKVQIYRLNGGTKEVGGSRSKERDRKSELVLRSTYQIFEWDRNNSDRKFYNVVRYVHKLLVP